MYVIVQTFCSHICIEVMELLFHFIEIDFYLAITFLSISIKFVPPTSLYTLYSNKNLFPQVLFYNNEKII